MDKTNTPNFGTKQSNVLHFDEFSKNSGKMQKDLEKMNRQQINDYESGYDLPNEFAAHYNPITAKYDTVSKKEVKDKIKSLKTVAKQEPKHTFKVANDEVNPNHFFKNDTEIVERKFIKKFESFPMTMIIFNLLIAERT